MPATRRNAPASSSRRTPSACRSSSSARTSPSCKRRSCRSSFQRVLVKGADNYISLRRLQSGAAAGAVRSSPDAEEVDTARTIIRDWSRQTDDGSRGDSRFQPPAHRLGRGRRATAATAWAGSARRTPSASTTRPAGGSGTPTCLSSTTPCSSATWPCAARAPACCPITRWSSSTRPTPSKTWPPTTWGCRSPAARSTTCSTSSTTTARNAGLLRPSQAARRAAARRSHAGHCARRICSTDVRALADDVTANENGRVPTPRSTVEIDLSPALSELAASHRRSRRSDRRTRKSASSSRAAGRTLSVDRRRRWRPGSGRARRTPSTGSKSSRAATGSAPACAARPDRSRPGAASELFDNVPTVILTSATLTVGGRQASTSQNALGLDQAARARSSAARSTTRRRPSCTSPTACPTRPASPASTRRRSSKRSSEYVDRDARPGVRAVHQLHRCSKRAPSDSSGWFAEQRLHALSQERRPAAHA